jgi:hypothetical protein
MVLQRDLLCAQVLLHRERVVGTALHRRVVRDDHARGAAHTADARDDPRPGRLVVVHPVGSERTNLQKRRPRIQQDLNALTGEQFSSSEVAIA